GRQVRPIYDAGHLVPDDLMIALIRERLGEEDARHGFVLDGFPRTMPQAEALEEMLREIGRDLDVVFEFQLADAVGVERMLTLALLGAHARPGVSTQELDELADEFIRSRGGTPTFKGYRGYPASICASPNEMVVHGIPSLYTLRDGDILSVDVGVTLDGFVAD